LLCFCCPLTLALATSAAAQTGSLDPPLVLSVDSRFPGLGGSSTFTITGPPNARFRLEAADTPAETTSSWGTHFLDLSVDFKVASGNLSALGEATVVVNHPSAGEFDGQLRYFQARGRDGAPKGLSSSIAVRFSPQPTGPRHPEAIAVTPDGSLAIVYHEEDATVSVIDAVTDTLLFDMPVTVVPPSIGLPIEVAIDPDGRRAFLINPQLRAITVVDLASMSIAGEIPVPPTCRGIAFERVSARINLHVTNERDNTILTFSEQLNGGYLQIASTQLLGSGAGPIARVDNGVLVVGHRNSLELELIRQGQPSIARIPLAGPPLDITISGLIALVPTFTALDVGPDGINEVLEVHLGTRRVLASHLADLATDYFDVVASSQHVVVAGSGSGTLVIADALTRAMLEVIDLAPGDPPAVPYKMAIVPAPGTGSPDKLYVVNHFRETVRPVDLTSGPPFTLLPEISLAHSGQPRIPLVDLSDVENGEWFFDSVALFNGSAANPNLVTCATCHTHAFSDNINRDGLQAQPLWGLAGTEPLGWKGNVASITAFTLAAFNKHGTIGGALDPLARSLTDLFQQDIAVPVSPFLGADGSLSTAAQAGQVVFEGVANCSSCHPAPLFTDDQTIAGGVGTGLDPANVPTLRGLWSTAPYLSDGSAQTLMDVLLLNVSDEHGLTSTLTQQQLDDLVQYLLSL
jgi:mono/diheme cytochrome c family protein